MMTQKCDLKELGDLKGGLEHAGTKQPAGQQSTGVNELHVSRCLQVSYIQMYKLKVFKRLITLINTNCAFHAQKGGCPGWSGVPSSLRCLISCISLQILASS